jgi:hypothetical protein
LLVRTPEEWLAVLEAELASAQPAIDLYENYYAGNHRVAFATNWCALVVDSPVERLGVQGFRFGDQDEADQDAWVIWQANRLDAESIKAHTDAVKIGRAYLIIAPPRARGGQPRITVEHPSQVIVAHDPADRTQRLAALKKYRDADGSTVAVVYLPDKIVTFRTPAADASVARVMALGVELPAVTIGGLDQVSTQENPLGVVPVVELAHRPGTLTGGMSAMRPAIALNDAANKFFSDAIVASEFTAFSQRVLTGVEIPKDPITGEPIKDAELRAAVSRMWVFESPDAKVIDLKPGDLGNYVQMIDLAVKHIAAQTKTPPHYLLGQIVNLSADALQAAETGLVSTVKRDHVDFADPWEDAIRIAFRWRARARRADGDTAGAARDEARAADVEAETIWRDAESRSPGVVADSLVKKAQMGIPLPMLMEEAGYTPRQIRRALAMRQRDLMMADAMTFGANGQGLPPDLAGLLGAPAGNGNGAGN